MRLLWRARPLRLEGAKPDPQFECAVLTRKFAGIAARVQPDPSPIRRIVDVLFVCATSWCSVTFPPFKRGFLRLNTRGIRMSECVAGVRLRWYQSLFDAATGR